MNTITTNSTARRLLGTGLIASTVLGSVALGVATAAPASAATPRAAAATADVTRGFDIVNTTKHTLDLQGIDGAGERDQYQPTGTKILPGQSYRYEKVYYLLKRGETTLTFNYREALGDGSERISAFQVTLVVDAVSGTSIRTDAGNAFAVHNQGLSGQITISEKDFSEITVPASDAQRQAELLNQTCVSGLASCTFTPVRKEEGKAQIRLVAGGANNTEKARAGSVTTKVSAGTTSSVETTASAQLTINGILEAGLTHKYGGEWSNTKEETKVQPYEVGAYKNFNMWSRVLTERVTGDFTVKLGKTTWKLSGVHFDIPRADADVLYDSAERALTEQEKASLPKIVDIKPVG
ncbi:hypothetical protein RL72_02181 [Microbacterium azadirachtae]|uniref:Uncharacterized protein n=1 Tax=Microbacterium azadirachtae TaxID=582680 RepID=A0A0F0KRR6_9MICO|nr:hypothetical protein [Microbacterium azadirachtae]KJL22790.1 hypothetical protein RL72_02181 [Microbacterium azadirachtae]